MGEISDDMCDAQMKYPDLDPATAYDRHMGDLLNEATAKAKQSNNPCFQVFRKSKGHEEYTLGLMLDVNTNDDGVLRELFPNQKKRTYDAIRLWTRLADLGDALSLPDGTVITVVTPDSTLNDAQSPMITFIDKVFTRLPPARSRFKGDKRGD